MKEEEKENLIEWLVSLNQGFFLRNHSNLRLSPIDKKWNNKLTEICITLTLRDSGLSRLMKLSGNVVKVQQTDYEMTNQWLIRQRFVNSSNLNFQIIPISPCSTLCKFLFPLPFLSANMCKKLDKNQLDERATIRERLEKWTRRLRRKAEFELVLQQVPRVGNFLSQVIFSQH